MNAYWAVALLFGITLVFSLMGHPGTLYDSFTKYSSGQITMGQFGTMITEGIFSWNSAVLLGATLTAAIATGFNLIALIPFGLLAILINLITFPSDILTGASGLPPEIYIPISIFFWLLQILVMVSFLRSG